MKGYYKNDTLKIIAAIAMLIDHIGAVFFEELVFLRIIGRIAFPIFAFYVAMGFSWTSDYKKYICRMLGVAIITQIPYTYFSFILVGNFYHMNVLFTFTFALLGLYFFKRKNYIATCIFMLFPQVIAAFTLIDLDYGSYGVLMVFVFYLFQEDIIHRNLNILFLTIVHGFILYIPRGFPFYSSLLSPQLYCILALPLLDLNYKLKVNLPKYFFYVFYPAHIAVIVILHFTWFS